ncbi:rubrerythrin family protein [Candidatus Woesearchaeota archaeon]|nr:rubrerythrin family protein [Candidatus Woesearchaeota archaeon]
MNRTIKNLTKAFIGESMARNRYSFYAKTAVKEGYEQAGEIFLVTADNEREHAKWLFRLIQELKKKAGEPLEEIKVEADAPTTLGATTENLKAAIAGEHYENTEMYPEYAETAQKEGFPEIAGRLRAISRAEEHHEERFKKLLEQIENSTVFKKAEPVEWVCRKCGYVHKGEEPPLRCPSCDHETKHFERKCETY